MKEGPKLSTPVFATILLALMSSVLCFISVIIYLVINWNNPAWTTQVRLLFGSVGVVLLIVTAGMMFLFKRINR